MKLNMFSRKQYIQASANSDMANKQERYQALVLALHSDIFRYAHWLVKDKAEVENIVQRTFFRAWKSIDSLKDEEVAKSWLITILRRENARRFERKQLDVAGINDASVIDDQLSNENEIEIEYRELRAIMASLSEEYRKPLML